jgi:hypothetical protein
MGKEGLLVQPDLVNKVRAVTSSQLGRSFTEKDLR